MSKRAHCVNPNATAQVNAVLEFLASQSGKAIIAGQHTQTSVLKELTLHTEISEMNRNAVRAVLIGSFDNHATNDAQRDFITRGANTQKTVKLTVQNLPGKTREKTT